MLPKRKLRLFTTLSDNEKEIRKRIIFLDDLLRKEQELYNAQLDEAKSDIKREKAEQKEKASSQAVPTLAERAANFRHVEIDIYEFLYPYMALVGRGELTPNEQQTEELWEMHAIARNILEEFIPKREQALETCNTILQSDVE